MKLIDLLIHKINKFKKRPVLFNNPNKYAPKTDFKIYKDYININGYQEFKLYKDKLIPSKTSYDLYKKNEMLSNFFNHAQLQNKSYLDLGAGLGYFSFLAAIYKAKVTAIDIDKEYIDIINRAKRHFKINNLKTMNIQISQLNKTSDIICALSIIHWIYSCTEVFGSLDLILKFLSKITKETLIIEWIEPEDEAINYFKHIDFNENYVTDKYCKDLFIIALKKHFSSFESLGYTREHTREIYMCKK